MTDRYLGEYWEYAVVGCFEQIEKVPNPNFPETVILDVDD